MKWLYNLKFQKFIVIILMILFVCLGVNLHNKINENNIQNTSTKNSKIIIENGEEKMKELKDYFERIDKIILTKNNTQKILLISDEEFSQILNELEYMFDDAREMPAIGVSLDDSTRNEMKYGEWIELCFEERQFHNDMPFDSLLINVVSDYTGFNIIRKFEERYEGRCYYIDLMNGKTMKNLSDIIANI